MQDIIHVLTDNIANQIAAGEVIQRPSSAVKELLENAVDAGATEIRVLVRDAGKSLLQVIDNGQGMSEGDARICFGRHATSKIGEIEDLFRVRTMGFRGEALASIAAVSTVVLKTRRPGDEWGTLVEVEDSRVRVCEPVATPEGTIMAMKNLFFNVPARRHFLKSNASEMRHIVEEFLRVALAFPGVFFCLTSGDQEMYHLEKGTLKQRLVQVMGAGYASKLISVREHTDYLDIYGFSGKPETARKTRGEQFFFVNNRFVKSPYLHHAVMSAYQELIPPDSFPAYALFIDLDPAHVDINVHPTKQEIKFEDEKIVYAFVQAAVKHALAQFSVTPTLDFDLDASIQQLDAVRKPFTDDQRSAATDSPLYRTFSQAGQAHKIERSELRHWEDFFGPGRGEVAEPASALLFRPNADSAYCQVLLSYILVTHTGGLLIVHQQAAHERILYERFASAFTGTAITVQQCLFPKTLRLSPPDSVLLDSLLGDLLPLGYDIEPFGKDTFVVRGVPADPESESEKEVIEQVLEQFKHSGGALQAITLREKLLRGLARQQAVKAGTLLVRTEMEHLVQSLLACTQPTVSPSGQPTLAVLDAAALGKLFKG